VRGPDATELTGWNVEAGPFLQSILDGLAQPVWVVDPEARIAFANPAAITALGYDDLSELLGRPSHETVHYKRPDESPFPVQECLLMRPLWTGETVHSEDDWFVRRDGSMFPVAYWSAPLAMPHGRGAVTAFTDIQERRRRERAERERDVAEAREAELRAGRRRIVEAADAARRRLRRDLHDGAQQRFVIAAMNLQLARDTAASDPARSSELLDAGVKQVIEGIDELREFATHVHPQILNTRGLTAAIQALAARMPIPVKLDLAEARLAPEAEATVYFFVSEALTNVIKHSGASEAAVRVAVDGSQLTVEVRDDGTDDVDLSEAGRGLAGLRERIAALDGQLEVMSGPSVGTVLRATLPMSPGGIPTGVEGGNRGQD
jgi:PAS domain S-box-containing protein